MAVPIPGLFNTGVDGAGTVLAGGSDDPHYTINELSDAAAKVMTNPHGSWIANDTNSKWIWANADGQPVNVTYTFATTFDLTGYDLSTVSISGRWATDNAGDELFVNGTATGQTSAGFGSWTSFTIPNSELVSGVNTIEFEVRDFGVIAGFRAEISGTGDLAVAAVPEAGSTMVLGLISAGALFLSRSRLQIAR